MIARFRNNINVGMAAAVVILSASIFMIGNAGVAGAASLRNNPKNAVTWMDDNCYSTLSVASSSAPGMLGPFAKFGLVNAVVRIPIYDWDQNVPSAPLGTLNGLPTDSHSVKYDEPAVKPVGYVERFSGTVTPLPNIRWAEEYVTKGQAQYDIGVLGGLIGISNPHKLPNPAVANPLLYQRASIYLPNGTPNFANINPGYKPGTPGESDQDIIEDGLGGADQQGGIIQDNVDEDQIDAIQNGGYTADNLKNNQGSPFGFFGAPFSIDSRNNPSDNCYEYLNTDAKKVPAYAFSVPKFGLPFTIPGTAITPLLWLMGELNPFAGEISLSGVTFYPQSANGKMMLDCYGRGITKTIVPGKPIKDYSPLQILPPYVPVVKALAYAADIALSGGNPFPPQIVQRLPMPIPTNENYYNGMAYLFTMNDISRGDMPAHLRGRDIETFKKVSVNTSVLAHRDMSKTDNGGHVASNNGSTYYPNLYIKLKKPYRHNPRFVENSITPDGQSFNVTPQIEKDGFKGDAPSVDYDKGGGKNDKPANGSARARIAEVVIKPGHTGTEIRNSEFKAGELGTTNGLNPDELCGFLRGKVPNSTDAIEDCDADKYGLINLTDIEGINEEDDTDTVNLLADGISRKIDAETPPGTKFCYAIYLDKRDNDLKFEDADYYTSASNYNDDYSAERDKRYLSQTHCVISGYKPSLQVRGGDMMVDGGVHTATNLKDYLPSTLTPGSEQQRTYGSWSEYGLFATGPVSGAKMGSGANYRVGQHETPANPFDPHGYLTFSNHKEAGNAPQFGNFKDDTLSDGFDKVAAFFFGRKDNATDISTRPAPCNDSNTIKLNECASGDYYLTDGGTYTIDGAGFDRQEGESLVFFVGDDTKIIIESDIKTQNEYEKPADISQVVFTPAEKDKGYLVNIAQDVKQVDAWMINPSGTINTCYFRNPDGSAPAADTPRSKVSGTDPHPCYENRLVVNGPVAAQYLFLRRSGGVDQNQTAPYTPVHQSIPGEIFNLRPDAYLWAQSQVSSGGQKFITVQTIDLPPRY